MRISIGTSLLMIGLSGQLSGQNFEPCSTLPPEFWCYSVAYFDTLNLMSDTTMIVTDTLGDNELWQRAAADKYPFNSPTIESGLVTDSLQPYPISQKADFLVKIVNPMFFIGLPVINLFFEHRFQTDSLLDGGYLTYSCDHGLSWRTVGFTYGFNGPPMLMNYHNYPSSNDAVPPTTTPTLHDTIPAFTGSNADWQWSGVQWIWEMPVMRPDDNRGGGFCDIWNMDTLYVRFTFESDETETGKAGWMIRNIVTGGNDIGGSLAYLQESSWSIAPNPADNTISISAPQSGEVRYAVNDLTGRNVLSGLTERGHSIDITGLIPGVYTIQMEQADSRTALRLVKY